MMTEIKRDLVEVDDLVGLGEIAELFSVRSSAVSLWSTRYEDFPRPIKRLKSGSLFLMSDVQKWKSARDMRKSRLK